MRDHVFYGDGCPSKLFVINDRFLYSLSAEPSITIVTTINDCMVWEKWLMLAAPRTFVHE
jgi:hypothetical protein